MFTRLRTRLTVLYAGLFGIALLFTAAAVFTAIRGNAERTIRQELVASGTVFDRIWSLRSQQLRDSADLLARDFGFREAVATGDQATVESALDNLRRRVGIDLAFIVSVDGQITGADGAKLGGGGEGLWTTLSEEDAANGVLMIEGRPYQAISAPVLAPVLTGWVVFATKLDAAQMRSLEALSAIPLNATVVTRRPSKDWSVADPGAVRQRDAAALGSFIDGSLVAREAAPGSLNGAEGQSAALVKRLPSIVKGDQAVLLLRYPLTLAMRPYQPMLISIAVIALLGMGLLIVGSWALARSLTRPISALDEAAHQLQRGEAVHLEVSTNDEIGRLAESFNTMASAIGERERRITHLATHDAETGLPNRLALEQDVDRLSMRDDPQGVLIVAAFGIDRFQYVRGAIGYGLAGALVRELGARMSRLEVARSVARLSTDALGLVYEAADLGEARAIADELLRILEEPIALEGERVDVSLTIGLSACGMAEAVIASPTERAAIALDQARTGRRKTAYFDEAAYGDPSTNLSMISELRTTIAEGGLRIFHQPKYDLRRGEVTGVEALCRWPDAARGMVPPDVFISMAEDTGHIRALTEWVLDQAIADQKVMRAAGRDLTVSVNISGRLMDDAEFTAYALERIKAADAKLCFEITETAVIDNPELALMIVERLVEAGVGISIDDYGSGLSSLTYLKQIRATELKIDKSFITALSVGKRDALLVKSTIDLAHGLGMQVVAEGVETGESLAVLTGMGCDIAQGYLISRPVPLEDLMAYLDAEDSRSEGAA